MSDGSKIQWTDATWPVVAGCDKVSAGCRSCYAIKDSWRLSHHPNPKVSEVYEGTAEKTPGGKLGWTGLVRPLPQRLDWPLKWRKPRRVFVCNLADLFHPDVPFDFIDRVFGVMATCPHHVFQILTKRPERMAEYSQSRERLWVEKPSWEHPVQQEVERWIDERPTREDAGLWTWPLSNVWCGTSVEDQDAADERIPHLLRTPAAVRFLSCEPLIGPVEISRYLPMVLREGWARPDYVHTLPAVGRSRGVDWVIVGGESGPRARPCDVAWIRSLVRQCRDAGVACFVKQLGAHVLDRNDAGFGGDPDDSWDENHVRVEWLPMSDQYQGAPVRVHLRDRKGGDMEEFPADLRIREFPE